MNQSPGVVEAQLQHLLEVVEDHRAERCAALREAAALQSQQLLDRAWREARARLHQAVAEARREARRQLASAQAQLETRQRAARHRENQAQLARAWDMLREQLRVRWQQSDSRRQWVDELVQQASASLIERTWHIEHPSDWPESERAEVSTRLRDRLGDAPILASCAEIDAGLRIRAGDTCIDATIDGLLRGAARIEALMLAALNECRHEAAPEQQSRAAASTP